MNIYHLSLVRSVDWDEYYAFVVVADSEEEARKFAACNGGGTNWLDVKEVTCVAVGRACSEIAAGVLTGSSNRG